jgi:ferredoxin-NADP reductase
MEGTAVRRRLTWQTATVGAVIDETSKVRTLSLNVPDWGGHQAGQHLDIALTADDGYRAERSYSIASAPGEPVAITVERLDDGEVSPYLTEDVQIGDEIEVRGPIGGYFIWDPPVSGEGPLLLAAGGSGVVPLRAIIRHRCLVGSSVPVRLLYSVRSQAEVIYRSELDHLNQEADGVKVIYALTRQQPPGWTGYARRVDQQIMAEVAWPVASGLATQVASGPVASGPVASGPVASAPVASAPVASAPLAYVCGPTNFVEAVASDLVALGYPPQRVKTERFGATGTP